jgi:hypothetical protein
MTEPPTECAHTKAPLDWFSATIVPAAMPTYNSVDDKAGLDPSDGCVSIVVVPMLYCHTTPPVELFSPYTKPSVDGTNDSPALPTAGDDTTGPDVIVRQASSPVDTCKPYT